MQREEIAGDIFEALADDASLIRANPSTDDLYDFKVDINDNYDGNLELGSFEDSYRTNSDSFVSVTCDNLAIYTVRLDGEKFRIRAERV
jgi:hypothetical protein